jgi:carbonic anhydrase
MDGNVRFINDEMDNCYDPKDRREATFASQKPFAVIVGCSDSRVPPEIVFDQAIGDVFVVRVAGNVVGPLELDSIDYSIIHNGSVLIVVLGHENCGAIKAVLDNNTKDIEDVAALIAPAIANSKNKPGNAVENAVKSNIRAVVSQLQHSRVIEQAIKDKKVKAVGAYYHLATGKVDFLPEVDDQVRSKSQVREALPAAK